MTTPNDFKIGVIIPCYREKVHIVGVIDDILKEEVDQIYVVDDCCPEKTGQYVEESINNPRVKVLYHEKNKGVGGALVTGYKRALQEKLDIVVKIDGDGQMSPSLIPKFIRPIIEKKADYTKGNRFYSLEVFQKMPLKRLFGNTILSFINKLVNGYWNSMDPTNGYTAISAEVLKLISLEKVSNDFFFESDMLFRLGIIRAKVKDVSIPTIYREETSSLSIKKVLVSFPPRYFKNFLKRIFYNYIIRDFNFGSLMILVAPVLLIFGFTHGIYHWNHSISLGVRASTGTVMISTLSVLLGFQSLLFFFQHDMNSVPKESLTIR